MCINFLVGKLKWFENLKSQPNAYTCEVGCGGKVRYGMSIFIIWYPAPGKTLPRTFFSLFYFNAEESLQAIYYITLNEQLTNCKVSLSISLPLWVHYWN